MRRRVHRTKASHRGVKREVYPVEATTVMAASRIVLRITKVCGGCARKSHDSLPNFAASEPNRTTKVRDRAETSARSDGMSGTWNEEETHEPTTERRTSRRRAASRRPNYRIATAESPFRRWLPPCPMAARPSQHGSRPRSATSGPKPATDGSAGRRNSRADAPKILAGLRRHMAMTAPIAALRRSRRRRPC